MSVNMQTISTPNTAATKSLAERLLERAAREQPAAPTRISAKERLRAEYFALLELRTPKVAGSDPLLEPARGPYSWKQIAVYLEDLGFGKNLKPSTIQKAFEALSKEKAEKAKAEARAAAKAAAAAKNGAKAEAKEALSKGPAQQVAGKADKS